MRGKNATAKKKKKGERERERERESLVFCSKMKCPLNIFSELGFAVVLTYRKVCVKIIKMSQY